MLLHCDLAPVRWSPAHRFDILFIHFALRFDNLALVCWSPVRRFDILFIRFALIFISLALVRWSPVRRFDILFIRFALRFNSLALVRWSPACVSGFLLVCLDIGVTGPLPSRPPLALNSYTSQNACTYSGNVFRQTATGHKPVL